jgi:hypothetical protein
MKKKSNVPAATRARYRNYARAKQISFFAALAYEPDLSCTLHGVFNGARHVLFKNIFFLFLCVWGGFSAEGWGLIGPGGRCWLLHAGYAYCTHISTCIHICLGWVVLYKVLYCMQHFQYIPCDDAPCKRAL